jgi:hypothetical protein
LQEQLSALIKKWKRNFIEKKIREKLCLKF